MLAVAVAWNVFSCVGRIVLHTSAELTMLGSIILALGGAAHLFLMLKDRFTGNIQQ